MLKGSDEPEADQLAFFKAQILFWLIGATDGHAKNFSIFLMPGGRYRMTPLYDALTAQPSLDSGQIQRKAMKLAMSVGEKRRYRIDDIVGRHFIQTGEKAGLPRALVNRAIDEVADRATAALEEMETILPGNFPEAIHTSVAEGTKERIRRLRM